MFDILTDRKNVAPRRGLYCVWIRAHEAGNAPLIQMWIDPSMSTFDSEAKVHEPDFAVSLADSQETACREDNS
jgi:hypothetical protein